MKSFLLVLALSLLVVPSAQATTCRSGRTIYKDAGMRVFYQESDYSLYGCGTSGKPVFLYSTDGAYGDTEVRGKQGGRLVFVTWITTEGADTFTTVGWFDGQRAFSGTLAGMSPNKVLDAVVAPDGGIAVASADTRVGYLAPGSKRELGLSPARGYKRGSLAVKDGIVTWQDVVARSVPATGEPVSCTGGQTLVERDGVRVFEALRGSDDVLGACAGGALQELAVKDAEDETTWAPQFITSAGARTAFAAGPNAVVTIDGAVSVQRLTDISGIDDVAIGGAGPAVFAGVSYSTNQQVVGRVDAAGWTRLASQGGKFVRDSLAVTGERVTWRDRFPQSAPIAGETAVTCTSGTTRVDRDGLRVFDVMLGDQARLATCAPGAAVPLTLRTDTLTTSWGVLELARDHGRIALYVDPNRGDAEYVMSFDAARLRVARAPDFLPYGETRDAAISADGRVAMALRSGAGRWRIFTAIPGKGRLLVRPKDGVKIGSLAWKGDRVTWRGRTGRLRSS